MNKPYFDYYNYSGLQRSVTLVALPEESVFDFDLTYELNGADAKINYSVKTTGSHDVKLALLDADGQEVASAEGKEGTMEVKDAHLWEVHNAYLYRLVIRIVDDNAVLDEYEQEIGIRTVEVRGTSILLNDKPVYLRGFGKHEDSDVVGRGFNIGNMKRDFELMKWVGANSFRTSHYPYSEEIYQMADREGFLIIDEVPAVGLFESLMNFAEASTGKQTAFFEKETTPILLKAHLKALEEMITRDKNHPCVIAWSLLNEPETTSESAVPYFEKVFARARELDPQKRPRTFALVMNSLPDVCKCYQFSDIIALNRYYGWYVMGGNEISNAEEAFRKEMDAWAAKDLNKPFIFTEYGADTYASEHKLPSVMWSQEYQNEYMEMQHRVFDSYDFVKGEQMWNFADFQTTEGIMRVNGNKKGAFTRQRQPKDIAYLLKKRWEELPLDYKG
jgi:beta-glucuronidase